MGVFGQKKPTKKEQRREVTQSGGTTRGRRQARKGAQEADAGRLGDDGKVRDTRGQVIGDFSGRTRKAGREVNQNGVWK
ncbi:hypothetical protein [Kribbella speibonae]|uniref:Uncharacterized protein n=1 Tax=Kribbella speibonae TaxID=1572660 RepID=A0A4V2M5X4_9ACTN|nr:hypothetical protein [Kribbella speibonae]TCC41582.1 hypothetical protein E0H92_07995 [Kribbella speibonae]